MITMLETAKYLVNDRKDTVKNITLKITVTI